MENGGLGEESDVNRMRFLSCQKIFTIADIIDCLIIDLMVVGTLRGL